MCRILLPEVIEGESAPCSRLLLIFHTMCYYSVCWQPSLLLASRTLDPQSLWWRREWHVTSVARPTTADLLLVVLPTTFWTLDLCGQNPLLGGFLILRPHCHYVVRAFFYMRRCLCPCITYDRSSPWISSRMFLYHPEHHLYSNSHVV